MSDEDQPQKPAVLQDITFVVEEGMFYKVFRTGSIWMNKLFLSSLVLLGIWLLMGATGAVEPGCVSSPNVVETDNGTVDQGVMDECSVWLSSTAKFLGAMSILSFIASIGFGLLGLVVGKNIFESTATADEVGARREDNADDDDKA